MRDIRKTLSSSMDHLHDLVFDRFDDTDSLPFGASFAGTIYREGYLFKQSRKMWKLWKTRYFVLRDDGLFFYRSKLDKDGEPMGVVPLKKLSVHVDDVKDKGRPQYCLRLGSGYGFKTSYCLCSFSKDERDLWFTLLLTAISQDIVSNCSSTFKYRSSRSSSASSTDSVLSDPTSSPNTTPKRSKLSHNKRTKSCELGSLSRVRDITDGMAALSELTECNLPHDAQTLPKKSRKTRSNPLRRLKALSSLDFKGWRDTSYIDLSMLQS